MRFPLLLGGVKLLGKGDESFGKSGRSASGVNDAGLRDPAGIPSKKSVRAGDPDATRGGWCIDSNVGPSLGASTVAEVSTDLRGDAYFRGSEVFVVETFKSESSFPELWSASRRNAYFNK